jgi:hypothetical protein
MLALSAQASLKLGSGLGQAKVRFGHLRLRLKQQLLRSKDRNGNYSCRDSDVEFPVSAICIACRSPDGECSSSLAMFVGRETDDSLSNERRCVSKPDVV